ncbi:type II toxin-antitoxin system RelE/ParE family toxin [Granulicella sp. WH15]|uniref:type II toxin-antitoxin system RelE family toxin n=1 Tax=Granulicella sp. WH15 TaxID=2602070 RepID=UPI0013675A94|nr:type II toxin-antitoxin system RelE/ParE family toxin [Granulicella sp. WH15]QHN03892.1 type II toxin-antitoxin system RelE/ParE family toxin [Granulicella sp. WH15]
MWRTEFTDVAERALLKLDKPVRERILAFFRERVSSSEDPKALAEPLAGEFRGLWRFRVGDYRVICDIRQDVLIVLVLQVGHRREVYR